MFTIIGGDGNEYGPATVDELRKWIAAGRASAETRAKRTGEEQWQRLGNFPEFSDHSDTAPPPLSTATTATPTGAVDPKAYADELIARAAPLDIGHCLERSWNLLKNEFWPIVGATFVVTVILGIGSSIQSLQYIVGLLLSGVFYGGLYLFYLKKIRREPVELTDLFSGFTLAFLPLVLATLVGSVLTIIGFFLLILPGVYLAVAYCFAYLLVIDQKLNFWTALEVSRRVVTAQWFRVFAVLLLGTIVATLGFVVLFVGIFFTLPILIGAVAYAYEDLCNPPPRPDLKISSSNRPRHESQRTQSSDTEEPEGHQAFDAACPFSQTVLNR